MALTSKQHAFIVAFAECGQVGVSATKAGVTRQIVWVWKRDNAEFRAQYEQAKELAAEALEDKAREFAFDGSERLMVVLLRALRPEIYKERAVIDLASLSDERIRGLLGLQGLADAAAGGGEAGNLAG